ncbi:MAG: hypothetical protein HY867_01920 [Chloroflexi bacterium]|nr:hypothetical protein [Chloroflexota bacterium]
MTLDDAIQKITAIIKDASASADVKPAKISDEEARLTVIAPAGDIQKIKDATFLPVMDLLKENLDVQVFVYDKDAPPPKG